MWKKDRKYFKYKKSRYITADYSIKKNKKTVINNIKIKNLLILKIAYKHKELEFKNK